MAVDVLRGESITVLASAARTATPTVGTFRVARGDVDGLVFVIDVTAVTDTPSVVFTIVGVDPISTKTWTILASAARTETGVTVLRVHPSLTVSANLIAKDVMPTYWSVTAVHGDADPITYSAVAYLV